MGFLRDNKVCFPRKVYILYYQEGLPVSRQSKFYQKLAAAVLAVLVAFAAGLTPLPSALAHVDSVSVGSAPSQAVDGEPAGEDALPEDFARSEKIEVGEGAGVIDSAEYFSPANANIDGSMYSRLSARQKNCYNALQNITIDRFASASRHEVDISIAGFKGQKITGTSFGGSFTPTGSGKTLYDALHNDMQAAVVALRLDRPDMVWLHGSIWTSMTFYVSRNVGTIDTVSYQIEMPFGGKEKSMQAQMITAAKNIARQAMQQPDTYSRVKAAHDILAGQNKYGHTMLGSVNEKYAHVAYSALIANDGYDPVCDGYSKAMKMVLDEMGIPCVCVISPTHMWNNVKMDDGLWYNLDLTWDDGGAELDWDYFLIGSHTVVAGNVYCQEPSHVEQDPFADAKVTLGGAKYPRKNKDAYIYLGRDYPPLRYSDVPRDAWFYNQVETVSDLGYFSGNNKGKFDPNGKFTRAQFATVMASALGVDLTPYKSQTGFSDVKSGQWYAAAANWARQSGMMSGDNRGRFRPNATITKEEICVVLYKALGLQSSEITSFFADDYQIAPWARYQVYACREAGLISGDNLGKVNPKKGAVRSEAAAIFAAYAQTSGRI